LKEEKKSIADELSELKLRMSKRYNPQTEASRIEPKSAKNQLSDLKLLMSKKYKEPQTDKAQLSNIKMRLSGRQQISASLQKVRRESRSTVKLKSISGTHKESLMIERGFGSHVEMSSAAVLEVLKQTKNTLGSSPSATHVVKS